MSLSAEDFLNKNFGRAAADSLELLAASGSSRKYYRFFKGDKSLILTEGEDVKENLSFLMLTRHFSGITEHIPEVILVSDDNKLYVQNDLGSESLMDLLLKDRSAAKPIYEKAVRQLVKVQVLGDKDLDYEKVISYPVFNYLLVLRDLFSFKDCFLNLSGVEYDEKQLLEDFEKFAGDFEKIPYKYFVYRDFQSRNIMVHEREAYFIDYQGGLKGPVQYDLVSLLWQARAELSQEWKEEFYDIYVKEFIEITGRDLDGFEFRHGYHLCLIERLLQVLGTYGLRGIFERKPHFLSSIAYALENLKKISTLEELENYPEMKRVIVKLSDPESFNKIKKWIDGK